MPKFVFAYHGGGAPSTPEEGEKAMAAWGKWMEENADAFADMGAPVGMSKTVTPEGVVDNGGANPISGYSVVKASDIDAACKIAAGCPIMEAGGSVEVAEQMEM